MTVRTHVFCFCLTEQRYHAYFMYEVDPQSIIAAGLSYFFCALVSWHLRSYFVLYDLHNDNALAMVIYKYICLKFHLL